MLKYIVSISIKAAQFVLQFSIAVALARILTVSDYGTYNVLLSLALLISIPASNALETFAIRLVASKYDSVGFEFANFVLKKLLVTGVFVTVAFGCSIIILLQCASEIGYTTELFGISEIINIMIWSIVFGGMQILSGVLRGLGYKNFGQLPASVSRHVILIFLLGWAYLASNTSDISPNDVLLWHSIAIIVTFCLFYGYYIKFIYFVNYEINRRQKTPYIGYGEYFWLSIVGIVTLLQMRGAVFIIEFFSSSEQVAFFRAAFEVGLLVVGVVEALNAVAAPKMAYYYKNKPVEEIEYFLFKISCASTFFAIIVFFVCWKFGIQMITGIFGENYQGASIALTIIAMMNVVRGVFAPIHVWLRMSNASGILVKWSVLGMVIQLSISSLLVPRFGAEGAALGALVGLTAAYAGAAHSALRIQGVRVFLHYRRGYFMRVRRELGEMLLVYRKRW